MRLNGARREREWPSGCSRQVIRRHFYPWSDRLNALQMPVCASTSLLLTSAHPDLALPITDGWLLAASMCVVRLIEGVREKYG